MKRIAGIVLIYCAAAGAGEPQRISGDFPRKPIRLVTAEPGGGNDVIARIMAPSLTTAIGQQIIVDNRGGSANIAAGHVSKATADGYSILLYSGTIWILPLLGQATYDPIRDFTPITLAVSSPVILVVHPSVPANSVRDLIAIAKAKPGSLNYANAARGSSIHLASELFKSMAGVNIVPVFYKGAGPAILGLVAGQVQVMFPNAGSVLPHVNAGRLKGLAVTTLKRSPLVPGMPTVSEAGLPGYESATTFAYLAPAGTPADIVGKLNQEIVNVLNRPEVRDRLFGLGMDVVGSTPGDLGALMKSEMAKLDKVVKEAGMRDE